MQYRREIDGLRALAVLPVVLFHAKFESFSGGYVGVDIFFVISGFLITNIVLREIEAGTFTLKKFYERRARRILPAIFFVISISIPVALYSLTPSDLKDFGQSVFATTIFSSNILFWLERGYFGTALELKPLLHTWSLAVEEQFYIFFPLLLLSLQTVRREKVVGLCILTALLSFTLAHISSFYGVYERVLNGSFYLIPTRAWELFAGALIALMRLDERVRLGEIGANIFSLLGIVLICYAVVTFDDKVPFPSAFTLMPVLGAMLIIIFAVPGTLVNQIMSCKVFVGLGLISYSFYLWHQPIFAFSRHLFGPVLSAGIYLFLIFLAAGLAYLSWRWIEAPFRDREKFSGVSIFRFSVVGTAVIGLSGRLIAKTDGLLNLRTEPEKIIYKEFLNLGVYNPIHMRNTNLAPFDEEDKVKLLIIGDSFAEDLTNAVFESLLVERFDVSTYRIPAMCGVLFVEASVIEPYQPRECRWRPSFTTDPQLIDRIREADKIWLASKWSDWQIDFISDTLSNLKVLNDEITVFGKKEFNIRSASQFGRDYGVSGIMAEFDVSQSLLADNNRLRHIAGEQKIQFVNIMELICGSYQTCTHSGDGTNLFSADGVHLTKYGARHLGDALVSSGTVLQD